MAEAIDVHDVVIDLTVSSDDTCESFESVSLLAKTTPHKISGKLG